MLLELAKEFHGARDRQGPYEPYWQSPRCDGAKRFAFRRGNGSALERFLSGGVIACVITSFPFLTGVADRQGRRHCLRRDHQS